MGAICASLGLNPMKNKRTCVHKLVNENVSLDSGHFFTCLALTKRVLHHTGQPQLNDCQFTKDSVSLIKKLLKPENP